MIVVDEYLAVWSLLGVLSPDVPNDRMALPLSAHWRLLQRLHAPAGGQLSRVLAMLPDADRETLRAPDPTFLEVPNPRPCLDEAAQLAARYGNTGWHIAETIVAGLAHGRQLWLGAERNIGHPPRDCSRPRRGHPRHGLSVPPQVVGHKWATRLAESWGHRPTTGVTVGQLSAGRRPFRTSGLVR